MERGGGKGALSTLNITYTSAGGFAIPAVSLWIRTRVLLGLEEVRDTWRLGLDKEQMKSAV